MASKAHKHKVRHVVEAAYSTPWAIEQDKLQEITEVLERRAAGEQLTEDEIQARIGDRRRYQDDDDDGPYRLTDDGVAVIPLQGVIMPRANLMTEFSGGTSTQQFTDAVLKAAADEDVQSIVIDVDSPGGSVLGVDEAAAVVRQVRDKKPVVAVATGQMCSAAYYIGSAAGEVVASPSSMVGSIGVYSIHTDTSRLYENNGIHRTLIKAGRNKAIETGVEPLTDDRKAVLQERTDDYYRMFLAAVADNRGIDTATVEKRFGQGKSVVASRALEAGMIDRISTLSEVVAALGAKHRPGTGHPAQPRFSNPVQEILMDKRIFEALVALGLCAADTDQAVAAAVLKGWYAAKGKTQPTDVDQVVKDLTAKAEPAPKAAVELPKPPETTAVDPAKVALAERDRITNIQARGEILGVDAATIQAAVDAGTSVEKFLLDVTRQQAAINRPVGKIESGPSSAEKFSAGAVEALLHRGGRGGDKEMSAAAKDFRYASLLDIARESLRVSHNRAVIGSPDQIARAALGDMQALHDMGVFGADVPFHSPGDFPNLLSNLAGKALDSAPRYRGTTFQEWARQRPSVPDFKPQTLVRVGEFGEMPLVPDGADFEQSQTTEEWSWLAVDSYGDEFAFTPRMMVDDDLGALMDGLSDKQAAADMTLNRLCVNLLTGNPLWTDGVALFAAGHGNLVALGAGAAPSQVTIAAARLAFRQLTGVGARRNLNYSVEFLLVPSELETTCDVLLNPTHYVVPITTATAEIFRGKVRWIVEPMLSAASTTGWYAFAAQDIARCIVYAYQRGFEKLQKRDYYNPKNNCRIFQFEQRMAAAVNTHRGVYFNAGA